MEKKELNENENIKDGLESFLDQELYGYTAPKDNLDLSMVQNNPNVFKPEDDLDVMDFGSVEQPVKHKTAEPVRRREPETIRRREPEVIRRSDNQNRRRESEQTRRRESESAHRREPEVPRGRKVEKEEKEYRKPLKKESRKPKEKMSKKADSRKKGGKKNKKEKKKKNGFIKFLIILLILFAIGFLFLQSMVSKAYNKMTYEEAESYTKEPLKEDGVINILLIGNDSRLNGEDGRSDAMILMSISDKTKTVTMTSMLRDMYVEIPGHDGNRLNAAYSYGGADLLMQTVEQNLGIKVDRYVLVNFQAFANLVDAVDGIDLELTNDEVQYVNGYLMEYNQLRGMDLATDFLDPSLSGEIHLNGPQALAYSRNRYIGTDFARTERQRKVLDQVMKKLPGKVLTNSNEIIDGLFPNLTTNLKKSECTNLTLNAWKFISYERVQQVVPQEGTYSDATIRDMMVLQVDFEANKKFLRQTIYGE